MAAETLAITIIDKDGNTVYTKSGIAAGANSVNFIDANNYPLQVPLSGDHTIKATITGGTSPGSASVGVALLIKND